MTHIQIIIGSTRPGRNAEQVAKWVYSQASKRTDATYELVDIATYNLPVYDEPMPPRMRQYARDHTKQWSEKIAQADGYIFVTPEYNHSLPGAFKNAVDYLDHEWRNKALGFVGYGVDGGVRSVEAWRLVAGELQMADVRAQLSLGIYQDFENFNVFKPTEAHTAKLSTVLDEVTAWARALQPMRV